MDKASLSSLFYGPSRVAEREPVLVLDVGCSGDGVGSEWDMFGSALQGVGFDPLVSEICRLNEIEKRPNVRYEAAFVGLTQAQKTARRDTEVTFSPEPMARSSAFRAAALTQFDHTRELYNSGTATEYSTRHISIDEWLNGRQPQVLKIDVDGPDVEVLLGAGDAIENSILALHVECALQASSSPYANSLATIDGFLREKGFSIFAIEPHRYSRAALPAPFKFGLLTQTTAGQPIWADVLFLRDMAADHYEKTFGFEATPERIIATACIMERFGLADCAAELLLHFANRLVGGVETALDALVPDHLGRGLSYRDFIREFEENPKRLLPGGLAEQKSLASPIVAKSVTTIDLARGHIDPDWGARFYKISSARIDLQTPPARWAFGYVAKLPTEVDGPGSVEVEVHISKGALGVGVLGSEWNDIAFEVILKPSAAPQVLLLPVNNIGSSLGVMFRNLSDQSSSRATISSAKLWRH